MTFTNYLLILTEVRDDSAELLWQNRNSRSDNQVWSLQESQPSSFNAAMLSCHFTSQSVGSCLFYWLLETGLHCLLVEVWQTKFRGVGSKLWLCMYVCLCLCVSVCVLVFCDRAKFWPWHSHIQFYTAHCNFCAEVKWWIVTISLVLAAWALEDSSFSITRWKDVEREC